MLDFTSTEFQFTLLCALEVDTNFIIWLDFTAGCEAAGPDQPSTVYLVLLASSVGWC